MVNRFHRSHYFLIWHFCLKLSTHEISIQQARVNCTCQTLGKESFGDAVARDFALLLYFIKFATVTQPLYYPHSARKVVPHHRGLCPLFFKNRSKSSVGSFKFHKNQNSERAVRQGLRFFVFIQED